MSDEEIRWYKGKWRVRIIKKSNVGVKGKHLIRNMLVEAIDRIPFIAPIGSGNVRFMTVPRLLWRHPRK